MRLISVELIGTYKGLSNQLFNFEHASRDVVALIGLNGSGKSQLLELIAETFAYIERFQREDFKVYAALPFGVKVRCSVNFSPDTTEDSLIEICISQNGEVNFKKYENECWQDWNNNIPMPIYIVGYASGLNENLQRAFMKNAVQYFEVMRVRMRRRREISGEVGVGPLNDINRRYLRKYPHLFRAPEQLANFANYFFPVHTLLETDTRPSQMSFIDYDSFPLLVLSLAIFTSEERDQFLSQVRYRHPAKAVIKYDLKGWVFEEDAIRDIRLLLRIAGDGKFFPDLKSRATDTEFDLYEIEYFAGVIEFDLEDRDVLYRLREINYYDPLQIFQRLYKIQLLAIKNWSSSGRKELLNDSFLGTVKKPLKSKMPIVVEELFLKNDYGLSVNIDDLSDGEAQLLQILGVASIYKQKQALFLFDEPETHLNPAWRTFFHSHLEEALAVPHGTDEKSQVFLSTHSPFMISSLRKENVFFFERNDNDGQVSVMPAHSQTYGASFEVLIKNYYGLKSLISQSAVEDVKTHLSAINTPEDRQQALSWIEGNLGESMEKAYLLRKLQN